MKTFLVLSGMLVLIALQGCAVNVVTVNHANLMLDDNGTSISADVVESNVKGLGE